MDTRAALYAQFPRLAPDNHRVTSDPCGRYNCVAWVERDRGNWWEPDMFWPWTVDEPIPEQDLPLYVELFERSGFKECPNGDLEDGYLKIAIYSKDGYFQHVAKQLPSGRWSSKAGPLEDLRHDATDLLEDVVIWTRASVEVYMRRAYDGVDLFEFEEGELILPSDGVGSNVLDD